jgi:hypothetical protein
LPQLPTVTQLCDVLKVSPSWIYQRTMESCREPLPVVRFGPRSLRFDREQVFHYIHKHERHWAGARLESSDGSAPINGKGHFKLAQKRFQAGSVRLRKDVRPPYWEGFYRDDIITEEGKTVRKRRSVYLGTEKDLSEKAARQKLGVILEPINSGSSRPRKMMTFRGFIQKYRTLVWDPPICGDGITPTLRSSSAAHSTSGLRPLAVQLWRKTSASTSQFWTISMGCGQNTASSSSCLKLRMDADSSLSARLWLSSHGERQVWGGPSTSSYREQ